MVTKLTVLLRELEPHDPVRIQVTKELINKLSVPCLPSLPFPFESTKRWCRHLMLSPPHPLVCCVFHPSRSFDMGVITNTKSLKLCEKLTVSAFCRRRLAVVLTRLKMAESMREAVQFVEHGRESRSHARVLSPCLLTTQGGAFFSFD